MVSKKGVFSSLGKLILAVVLFAVLAVALFGKGIIPELAEKIKNIINSVPEIDPDEKELNFFRNNDKQLEFFTRFEKVLQNSMSCVLVKDACISPLPNFDEGFYIEDGNYNLILDQTGNDINIRLTRWAKQDIDPNSAKTEAPVSASVLANTQLCIIKGTAAVEFYENFNIIKPNTGFPNAGNINPANAVSIIISSGIEENRKLERKIGFKLDAQSDYEYQTFFKKKDKTTIYVMRLQRGGTNYLCFLPAHDDAGNNVCGPPNNEGFTDSDCFDSDNGKYTLKSNIGKGLIPSYYVCGDSSIVDSNCLCGGKTVGSVCQNDFSKEQCECAKSIVIDYAKMHFNTLVVEFNLNPVTGKCEYNPGEGCKYLLIAEPNFLNEIKTPDTWQCTI